MWKNGYRGGAFEDHGSRSGRGDRSSLRRRICSFFEQRIRSFSFLAIEVLHVVGLVLKQSQGQLHGAHSECDILCRGSWVCLMSAQRKFHPRRLQFAMSAKIFSPVEARRCGCGCSMSESFRSYDRASAFVMKLILVDGERYSLPGVRPFFANKSFFVPSRSVTSKTSRQAPSS